MAIYQLVDPKNPDKVIEFESSGDPAADYKYLSKIYPNDVSAIAQGIKSHYSEFNPDVTSNAQEPKLTPDSEVSALQRLKEAFGDQPRTFEEPSNYGDAAKVALTAVNPAFGLLKPDAKEFAGDVADIAPDLTRMAGSTVGGALGSLGGPVGMGVGSLGGDKAAIMLNKLLGEAAGTYKSDEMPPELALNALDTLNFLPAGGAALKKGGKALKNKVVAAAKKGNFPERLASWGTGLSKLRSFLAKEKPEQQQILDYAMKNIGNKGASYNQEVAERLAVTNNMLNKAEAAAPDITMGQVRSVAQPHIEKEAAGFLDIDKNKVYKEAEDILKALEGTGKKVDLGSVKTSPTLGEVAVDDIAIPTQKLASDKRIITSNPKVSKSYQGADITSTNAAAQRALADSYREATEAATQGTLRDLNSEQHTLQQLQDALTAADKKDFVQPLTSKSDVLPTVVLSKFAGPLALAPEAITVAPKSAFKPTARKIASKLYNYNPKYTPMTGATKENLAVTAQALKQYLQGLDK